MTLRTGRGARARPGVDLDAAQVAEAVRRLFDEGRDALAPLAAPPAYPSAAVLDEEDFARTIDSMGTSFLTWVRALLARGLLADDARVFGLTSEGNTVAWKGYAAVAAAKVVLESVSRAMAVELAPHGVRSNVIQAGVTDTPALRAIPGHDHLAAQSRLRNPFRRLTTPQDVADVIYLLSTDEAAWINGAVIRVAARARVEHSRPTHGLATCTLRTEITNTFSRGFDIAPLTHGSWSGSASVAAHDAAAGLHSHPPIAPARRAGGVRTARRHRTSQSGGDGWRGDRATDVGSGHAGSSAMDTATPPRPASQRPGIEVATAFDELSLHPASSPSSTCSLMRQMRCRPRAALVVPEAVTRAVDYTDRAPPPGATARPPSCPRACPPARILDVSRRAPAADRCTPRTGHFRLDGRVVQMFAIEDRRSS